VGKIFAFKPVTPYTCSIPVRDFELFHARNKSSHFKINPAVLWSDAFQVVVSRKSRFPQFVLSNESNENIWTLFG
jgi:hypothetical protein